MITNLPAEFDVSKLEDFSFGDPDGAHDTLIKKQLCVCHIKPLLEFLRDRKGILIGDKGTGKTCLFQLLKEGTLKFKKQNGETDEIIAIDEAVDYKALKEIVVHNVISKLKDDSLKYRLVWEILVLRKVVSALRKLPNLPATVTRIIETFEAAFAPAKRESALSVFFGSKKKVGLKIGTDMAGMPTADCYTAFDPAAETRESSNASPQPPDPLHLVNIKSTIDGFLKERGIKFYLLVDKVDEFVIKEEYETQKLALQGLLGCERGYLGYENLRMKLFLRRDLYEKIDLREFGAEKVDFRTVELTWTAEDIRDFLAKRIFHNYDVVLGLSFLAMTVEEENLFIDRDSNRAIIPDSDRGRIAKRIVYYSRRLKRFISETILRQKIVPLNQRHTNFNDKINREIITTFFGEKVGHITADGTAAEVQIVDYLETRFKLGSGTATPRILLMFVEKCLEAVIDRYQKNDDLPESLVFYPVIPRESV